MKKGDKETVAFEKIVGGGQTLGQLNDGRKVFAWGVLPGETAEIELTKIKSSYAEGIVSQVIKPSEQRIEPADPIAYLATSPWQIMQFDYEQVNKAKLIREAFQLSNVDLQSDIQVVTDNKMYGYRNKMEYSLWWDHDTELISLAFHKRGTHQKIAVPKSSIERPEIFKEASQIVEHMNDVKDSARKYQSVLVRADQNGKAIGAIYEKNKPHPKAEKLTDSLLGREYSYSLGGFFQINLPVYEMTLKEIAAHITANKIVDMYSGVGTIGLSVANGRKLTLVETDRHAFDEMLNNIKSTDQNVQPINAKSEEALEHITNDATIILDPPRAGLDPAVVSRLQEIKPPQIIYLSCNPVTQARDIAPLLGNYQISHVQGFNFFPRTPHIENLVVLDKVS